jgi:hypothetical protein
MLVDTALCGDDTRGVGALKSFNTIPWVRVFRGASLSPCFRSARDGHKRLRGCALACLRGGWGEGVSEPARSSQGCRSPLGGSDRCGAGGPPSGGVGGTIPRGGHVSPLWEASRMRRAAGCVSMNDGSRRDDSSKAETASGKRPRAFRAAPSNAGARGSSVRAAPAARNASAASSGRPKA